MSCYSRGCNQPHKQAELMPGDTIKCHDADDAAQVHEDLCRGGYETEFIYEMDGVKGIWIEIKGKERTEMAELNIDTFGEIMDDFIEKNHIQMLIDIPEGTNEPQIKDNAQLGGVVQFYILLTAMKPIYKDIHDKLLDHSRHEDFIDGILQVVKNELMEVAEGEDGEDDGKL